MNPFIMLISSIISIINFLLIVYMVMSLLISFEILNKHQPVVARIFFALQRLIEPILRPIRNLLPDLGGIDISPIILILLLNFIEHALIYYVVGAAG